MTVPKEKNLAFAIGLNVILPGAGYIYMGRVVLGLLVIVLFALITAVSFFTLLIPSWVGLNIIMAIDMVILSNKNKAAVLEGSTVKCPHCAERIQAEAKVCKHCHLTVHAPAAV